MNTTVQDGLPPFVVMVTGQVGGDKGSFLKQVWDIVATRSGRTAELFEVGPRMYDEDPTVPFPRILDLPHQRLRALRRAVMRDAIALRRPGCILGINTHATFRWKHGLHPACDFDQLRALKPDIFVTVVDNVQAIHHRLRNGHDIRHTLKDILVWREEEILATELMAEALRQPGRPHDHLRAAGCFLIVARGMSERHIEPLVRCILEPQRRRVYPSFPMTHVYGNDRLWAEIDGYRTVISSHFTAFDPGLIDEMVLIYGAQKAKEQGQAEFQVEVEGGAVTLQVDEVLGLVEDIERQIYARDFKLIDQSDMLTAYIPELDDGKVGLSSGVEREMQYAHDNCKDVFVVWRPKKPPSPFVTRTATQIFPDVDALRAYFQQRGWIS